MIANIKFRTTDIQQRQQRDEPDGEFTPVPSHERVATRVVLRDILVLRAQEERVGDTRNRGRGEGLSLCHASDLRQSGPEALFRGLPCSWDRGRTFNQCEGPLPRRELEDCRNRADRLLDFAGKQRESCDDGESDDCQDDAVLRHRLASLALESDELMHRCYTFLRNFIPRWETGVTDGEQRESRSYTAALSSTPKV